MLSTLRKALKEPELRVRIIWTIVLVAIYRIGNFILVPGVDPTKLQNLASNSGSLFSFYDLMSGGAFSKFSIFALGVMPYINASIIMQLLTIAIPSLENLQKEGEHGRKKIQKYTRYASIFFSILMTFGVYALINNVGALKDTSKFGMFIIVLTLTTASTFLMWLGEQITVKGIGNGVSLIIFINIISRFPSSIYSIFNLNQAGSVDIVQIGVFAFALFVLFLAVVIASLAERRIPVQYAGKNMMTKKSKGQSSYIPININASAVIAIIFAMAVMQFPVTIASFWPKSWWYLTITGGQYSPFKTNSIQYVVTSFVFTVFFTWFYTQVTFKPDEIAENMHKSSGFIPGIRPGEETAIYVEQVLSRVALLWGVFAGIVAVSPLVIQAFTNFKGLNFTGTGLLIMVGVASESIKALKSQLLMRHYEGFLG